MNRPTAAPAALVDDQVRARARRAVVAACAAVGVSCTEVEVTETGSACQVTLDAEGTFTIRLPWRRVTALNDRQLVAVAAHEAAHVLHGDVRPASRTARLLCVSAFGLSYLAMVAALGWIALYLAPIGEILGSLLVALLQIPALVGSLLICRAAVRAMTRRDGLDPRIVELRADLTAARGVGHDSVTALLMASRGGIVRAVNNWAVGTHPTRTQRLEAVERDPRVGDVTAAARDLWTVRSRGLNSAI